MAPTTAHSPSAAISTSCDGLPACPSALPNAKAAAPTAIRPAQSAIPAWTRDGGASRLSPAVFTSALALVPHRRRTPIRRPRPGGRPPGAVGVRSRAGPRRGCRLPRRSVGLGGSVERGPIVGVVPAVALAVGDGCRRLVGLGGSRLALRLRLRLGTAGLRLRLDRRLRVRLGLGLGVRLRPGPRDLAWPAAPARLLASARGRQSRCCHGRRACRGARRSPVRDRREQLSQLGLEAQLGQPPATTPSADPAAAPGSDLPVPGPVPPAVELCSGARAHTRGSSSRRRSTPRARSRPRARRAPTCRARRWWVDQGAARLRGRLDE